MKSVCMNGQKKLFLKKTFIPVSFTFIIAMLFGAIFSGTAAFAQNGYEVVKKKDYEYRILKEEGPFKNKIAWAFDKPTGGSDCTGLLAGKLKKAEKIVFASYRPTHPKIVKILDSSNKTWGVYDANYCKKCEFKNKNIKPIKLGVYNEKSKRKWLVMHHKFAVLNYNKDQETGKEAVLTGSFNWNKGAAAHNYENIIYIKSRKVAEAFWKEYKRVKGKGAGNKGIVTDRTVQCAFNEYCGDLLVKYIKSATKSIYVAVWTVSPSSKKKVNPVYNELVKAAARGVKVKLITDANKAKGRDYGDIEVIRVHMDKGHMHHKFMVIDGLYVVSGSFNYVYKALNGNIENVAAVCSKSMAKSFTNHWKGIRKIFK